MKRFVKLFMMLQVVLLCGLLMMRPAGVQAAVNAGSDAATEQEQTVISAMNLTMFVAGENNQQPATRLVCTSLKHSTGDFLEKRTAIVVSHTQLLTGLFHESKTILPTFRKPDIEYPFSCHW